MDLSNRITLLTFLLFHSTSYVYSKCCEQKVVPGMSSKAGTYNLVSDGMPVPGFCLGGCAYTKENDPQLGNNYCFQESQHGGQTTCSASNLEVSKTAFTEDTLNRVLEEKFVKYIGEPINAWPYQSAAVEENKKMRNQTTINLFLAQSKFFESLDSSQLRNKYLEASTKNGLLMSKQCSMDTLVGCNDNQDKIINCIKKGPANFVECQENNCQDCACALGSLLGYDCNTGSMVRMIRNTSLPMTDFRNFLSSPHEESHSLEPERYFYVNYKGGISYGKTTKTLKQNLIEHRAYWTNTNGRIRSKRQEPISTAETIIAVGNELAKTIKETALDSIAKLDKEIQQVKQAANELSANAQKQIADTIAILDITTVLVNQTRSTLEDLAGETVDRVNKMEYYLKLVKDDWNQNKTAKFLGFQAKKMAELTDRSLYLLKRAHTQYTNITLNLSTIKGKMENVVKEIDILKNKDSEEFKKYKTKIREEVYIPCCVNPLGWIACPICAVTLEHKIKEWTKTLQDVENSLDKKKTEILNVETKVDDTIGQLEGECKLIANWQGKLLEVSEIDFKFTNSELFGFSAIKTEVVKTLDGLKTSAQNYLDGKSGSG